MSQKQMLYALTRVNVALAQPELPSGAELQELRTLVAEACAAGAQMLQHMGRPRDPDSAGKPAGRRPSARYRIEISNMAPRIVVGGQAAADAINEQLAELGVRQRVTQNNLTVGIARNGSWFKLVETSNGTVVLECARAKEQENSA